MQARLWRRTGWAEVMINRPSPSIFTPSWSVIEYNFAFRQRQLSNGLDSAVRSLALQVILTSHLYDIKKVLICQKCQNCCGWKVWMFLQTRSHLSDSLSRSWILLLGNYKISYEEWAYFSNGQMGILLFLKITNSETVVYHLSPSFYRRNASTDGTVRLFTGPRKRVIMEMKWKWHHKGWPRICNVPQDCGLPPKRTMVIVSRKNNGFGAYADSTG